MVAAAHAPETASRHGEEQVTDSVQRGFSATRQYERNVSPRWRILARTGFPFVVVAAIWEESRLSEFTGRTGCRMVR
jgi:hypothetical protein